MGLIPAPWLYGVIGAAWLASVAAASWWAYGAGRDAEVAIQAREERAVARATAAAVSAAASAISRIKVEHTTIQHEVQREISERVVYRDCKHSSEQLQRINAALTGTGSGTAGRGRLPGAVAADGP